MQIHLFDCKIVSPPKYGHGRTLSLAVHVLSAQVASLTNREDRFESVTFSLFVNGFAFSTLDGREAE